MVDREVLRVLKDKLSWFHWTLGQVGMTTLDKRISEIL